MTIDGQRRRTSSVGRHARVLALAAIAMLAGCLHEHSTTCGDGGLCPSGRQCADTGDGRICILLTCGNGHLDPGEACDDGNNRSGDGCPADCTPPCGDGVPDPGEICDDGNTIDGDGCSADCRSLDSGFSVSPTLVGLMATEGDVSPASVAVTVQLAFRGDSVVFGYPPGVAQPAWLAIAEQAGTANTARFKLQVADTSVAGEGATHVRFVTRHQRSTGLDAFDLPVSYRVEPSDLTVQTATATLAFTARSGGAVPSPRTVDLAFNGDRITVTAAPPWLTVSPPPGPLTSPASFAVTINTTAFAPGAAQSGDVVFATTRGTARRTATVRVAYSLVASVPEVRFVAPYVGIAGRGGTLHVRGVGFRSSGGPVAVRVGDLAIGPLVPDSDTQITLAYPPLPEGRYVVALDPPENGVTRAELVIVTEPPPSYHAVDAPSLRARIIYDAERQTIYAANILDQEIERFVYASGAWSSLAPRIIPQLTDIAMAPDGRSLIVTDRSAVNEISLTDGLFAPVKRADHPRDAECNPYFDQVAAADNGKFFIVSLAMLAQCSRQTSFLYDALDRSLVAIDATESSVLGASADGSRIYFSGIGFSPPAATKVFESLSGTVSEVTTGFNLSAVRVSGDASRVLLNDTYVCSSSLTVLGNIPYGFRYGTLLSRDSSRAFVYVPEAAGAHLDIYDLNGSLQTGELFPLLKTIVLPDTANSVGDIYTPLAMTSSLDDSVVFISGNARLLVVPVN